MIALRDGLPLVALPDGRSTFFDKHWITGSLRVAAERAGYDRWWLAEHISESVAVYLRRDFDATSVEVVNLETAVCEVLDSLGYDDIAAEFRLSDPPVRLSLADLVREAGEGYELAFFGLLGDRLQRVAGSRVTRLEIFDLGPCLRLLTRRCRIGRREGLREEIVGFIRQYGTSGQFRTTLRAEQPLEIQLS